MANPKPTLKILSESPGTGWSMGNFLTLQLLHFYNQHYSEDMNLECQVQQFSYSMYSKSQVAWKSLLN